MLFDNVDTAKMHGLDTSNVSRRVEPSGIWASICIQYLQAFCRSVFATRAFLTTCSYDCVTVMPASYTQKRSLVCLMYAWDAGADSRSSVNAASLLHSVCCRQLCSAGELLLLLVLMESMHALSCTFNSGCWEQLDVSLAATNLNCCRAAVTSG